MWTWTHAVLMVGIDLAALVALIVVVLQRAVRRDGGSAPLAT